MFAHYAHHIVVAIGLDDTAAEMFPSSGGGPLSALECGKPAEQAESSAKAPHPKASHTSYSQHMIPAKLSSIEPFVCDCLESR